MTNRVLIGSLPGGDKGILVSRPGFDVTSGSLTPAQKSFDSRWLQSARILTSGSVAVPAATAFPQFVTVSFTAQTSAPPVILYRSSPSGIVPLHDGNFPGAQSPWDSTFAFDNAPLARITASDIQIRRQFSDAFTAYYIVMRPI